MTQDEFTSILKEYNYSDDLIKDLWDTRGDHILTEEKVRRTCELMKALTELSGLTEKDIKP